MNRGCILSCFLGLTTAAAAQTFSLNFPPGSSPPNGFTFFEGGGSACTTATLKFSTPAQVVVTLVNAPWLKFAVVPAGTDCSLSTIKYQPPSVGINAAPNSTIAFQVSPSSNTNSKSYLPQGWYTGYLEVLIPNSSSNSIFLPVQLNVFPNGYLKLIGPNAIVENNGTVTVNASTANSVAITAEIDTNALQDNGNPAPTSVPINFQANDFSPGSAGGAADWLVIQNANGASVSQQVTAGASGFQFVFSLNPSAIPPGASILTAQFAVQSLGTYQDATNVTLTFTNVGALIPPTSFTQVPQSLSFSAAAQSQQITVNSSGNPINFQMQSSKPWLSVPTSTLTTPQTVTVNFNSALMTQMSDTATITISDITGAAQSVVISVSASVACTFSLPPSVNVGAAAGSGGLGIMTQAGCFWSAVSDSTWLTTSGQGTGPGTIAYSYSANLGAARTGHITAGGQQSAITQAGQAMTLPQIQSFTANPTSISYGSGSTLSWSVTNANSVSIDNGIGAVPSSGTQTVTPGQTTTYTLTATNSSGSASMTATVNVTGQPPSGLGILTASPNPIIAASGSITGVTTLNWSAPGTVTNAEIHIGAPNGPLLEGGGASGSAVTGNWVSDGMVFYLQDVTNGKPLTLSNTLDTVTVRLVPSSTTFFGAGPLYVPPGQASGSIMLFWNAPAAPKVQLWAVSSTGIQLTGDLPPSGWATFGPWVTQGMQFYLQLSQNGNASGDANTILTLQAGSALLSSSPPPPPAGAVTFTANPNPIIVGSLQTAGMTTLSWNAPGYSQLVILVGSANGTQMTGIEPGQGSAPTGSWVTDGMQFFLQNASSGTFTGATNTLATLTVRVQTSAMSLETPQVTSTTAGWRWVLAASATYFEVEIDKWMGTNWCSDSIGCAVETRRGAFTELPNNTGNFRWRVRGAGDAGKSLWTSWIYSAASR